VFKSDIFRQSATLMGMIGF